MCSCQKKNEATALCSAVLWLEINLTIPREMVVFGIDGAYLGGKASRVLLQFAERKKGTESAPSGGGEGSKEG